MRHLKHCFVGRNGAPFAVLSPNQTNHLQRAPVLYNDEVAAIKPALSTGTNVCEYVETAINVDCSYPSVLYNPSILSRLDVSQTERTPDEEVGG